MKTAVAVTRPDALRDEQAVCGVDLGHLLKAARRKELPPLLWTISDLDPVISGMAMMTARPDGLTDPYEVVKAWVHAFPWLSEAGTDTQPPTVAAEGRYVGGTGEPGAPVRIWAYLPDTTEETP